MDRVPFPITRYDQVASVVPDLQRAMQEHWERFGIGPWSVYTYGPPLVKDMTYRGQRRDYRMRLALCFSDNVQHELIEPLEGPSIYHDFLAERPGGGLHHIGVVVPRLDEGIAQLERAGYAVIQSGRGFGLRGDGGYAYFDTEPALGVLLELIERPAERVAPEQVYPAPSEGAQP